MAHPDDYTCTTCVAWDLVDEYTAVADAMDAVDGDTEGNA